VIFSYLGRLQEFYQDAEAFRNETESEVTEGIRNFTEIPLVKRLMEISPKNLSDPEVEIWPEKMIQSAMDDVTGNDIREAIERGDLKHRPETFLTLFPCRLCGVLTV